MVETRYTELRKDQVNTGALADDVIGRLERLASQMRGIQVQSKERWKEIKTQSEKKCELINQCLSVLDKEKEAGFEAENKEEALLSTVNKGKFVHNWEIGGEGSCRNANSFLMPKIEFPDFDGVDLEGWLYKCHKYFEIEHVPEDKKVKLASLYLFGPAFRWHFAFLKNRGKAGIIGWEEYCVALKREFGKEDEASNQGVGGAISFIDEDDVNLGKEEFDALADEFPAVVKFEEDGIQVQEREELGSQIEAFVIESHGAIARGMTAVMGLVFLDEESEATSKNGTQETYVAGIQVSFSAGAKELEGSYAIEDEIEDDKLVGWFDRYKNGNEEQKNVLFQGWKSAVGKLELKTLKVNWKYRKKAKKTGDQA